MKVKAPLKEFWESCWRGWPAGRSILGTGLKFILGLATIAAIVVALVSIPTIENLLLRVLAWVLVIGFLAFAAVVLGLIPYLGQRAIARELLEQKQKDIARLTEWLHKAEPFERYANAQKGHEGEYLHLVVEDLDLGVRDKSEKDVYYLKFQIVSGLVYEFRPHRLTVRLVVDEVASPEPWEMRPTHNLLPGKRSQFATKRIPIRGDKLMAAVARARECGRASAHVDVQVELKQGDCPITLQSEQRSWLVQ